MIKYIVRRVLLMVPTLIAVSMLSFLIIQAPAGDYVDTYVAGLRQLGRIVEQGQINALRDRYGLNQPVHIQYMKWASHLLRGDLGRSFAWNQPVKTLLLERLPWTILIAFSSLLVVYILAIPIGTTSAINQYSARDYVFTTIGFIGLAVPNFLFALVFLWLFFLWTGNAAVGLMAGSIIFVLSVLTVVGTLISDILLAWLDPRIREAV